jgi:hypothetical protein
MELVQTTFEPVKTGHGEACLHPSHVEAKIGGSASRLVRAKNAKFYVKNN